MLGSLQHFGQVVRCRGGVWRMSDKNSGFSKIRTSGNSGNPNFWSSGIPEFRISGNQEFRNPEFRNSGFLDSRLPGHPEFRKFRVSGFLEIRNEKLFPGSCQTHSFLIGGSMSWSVQSFSVVESPCRKALLKLWLHWWGGPVSMILKGLRPLPPTSADS